MILTGSAEEGEPGRIRDYSLSEIDEFIKEDALAPELAARIDRITEGRK